MPSDHYEIQLPADQWVSLSPKNFYQATDGSAKPQQTLVRLRRDENFLRVEFECLDDPYWHQSTMTEHNSDLWQQEVFEVFIAPGEDIPTRYLEVEINPRNALFVGWVENKSGEGDANILSMVPYESAGIQHAISDSTVDSWRGGIRIPLTLIDGPEEASQSTTHRSTNYRINFYRIVQTQPQTAADWVCAPANASFQCWRSTLSGNTPRFHRPSSFGILRFV